MAIPNIVGVSGNRSSRIVCNCNDVTLQVLDEIVCNIIVTDSANGAVQIIQRNQGIASPRFLDDIRSVKSIRMENAVHRFGGTNAVLVIGIGIPVKGFQLSSLFPSQGMTEVRGGVALRVFIISYCPYFVKKNSTFECFQSNVEKLIYVIFKIRIAYCYE